MKALALALSVVAACAVAEAARSSAGASAEGGAALAGRAAARGPLPKDLEASLSALRVLLGQGASREDFAVAVQKETDRASGAPGRAARSSALLTPRSAPAADPAAFDDARAALRAEQAGCAADEQAVRDEISMLETISQAVEANSTAVLKRARAQLTADIAALAQQLNSTLSAAAAVDDAVARVDADIDAAQAAGRGRLAALAESLEAQTRAAETVAALKHTVHQVKRRDEVVKHRQAMEAADQALLEIGGAAQGAYGCAARPTPTHSRTRVAPQRPATARPPPAAWTRSWSPRESRCAPR